MMDELDADRRLALAVHQRLPPILWIALVILAIATIGFSSLAGMENRRLHRGPHLGCESPGSVRRLPRSPLRHGFWCSRSRSNCCCKRSKETAGDKFLASSGSLLV